jgi:transcriptional regulator with XRE-family HTH domain
VPPVVDGVPGRASDRHHRLTATESADYFVRGHAVTMTEKLLSVNMISGTLSTGRRGRFSGVADSLVDSQMVAQRLRAVMGDLELETVSQLAKLLGAERSQVSNWLQGYNLPPPRWMTILCRKRPGLTLDWIYRGVADAVPTALAIKLEALLQGYEVPLTDEVPPSKCAARAAIQPSSPCGAQTAKRRKKAT